MKDFENRYAMDSDSFYERFEAGKIGDSMDFFEWVGLYKLLLYLRRKIQRLESAVVKDAGDYLAYIKALIIVNSQVSRCTILREEAQGDIGLFRYKLVHDDSEENVQSYEPINAEGVLKIVALETVE